MGKSTLLPCALVGRQVASEHGDRICPIHALTLICRATTRAQRAATFGGDDSLDEIDPAQARTLAGTLAPAVRYSTSLDR
jgi:hypothetical protein